ncbi:hypothetical protein HanPI659440_Chr17g0689141 [Helianthus annuus]|nr:hypothetical protein HanPI659440_Chr17g0689141 [Helianthus annuus]
MSIGTKAATFRKRKYKPKNPPGPDQAVVNWKEEELNNLVQNFGFSTGWGVQFPAPNCTALDAPPGYITLYADFFREGNFRLPMSKFLDEVLNGYGLHISQINALGLPRVTHFEFICRAQRVEPSFEKFNVFYFVTYSGGFYSFNSRTGGVLPCSQDPPKSLHDWKQKFFYIRCGVIPIDMRYRPESEGVAGAMAVAVLPEGQALWVDQIRDNFLHPSSESMATYATTILGDDDEDETDTDINPIREEFILLSSGESGDASYHLIHRSSRACP